MNVKLRDYFAAQAMVLCPNNSNNVDANAKFCYEMAEAMMKARAEDIKNRTE